MRVQNYVGCAENLQTQFYSLPLPYLDQSIGKGRPKEKSLNWAWAWRKQELFLKIFFSLLAPAFFGINLYFKLYFFSIFLLEQCAKRMM